MSKLLLVANIDDDYLGVREEKLLTEKPRDVIEGVGYGC
jgi:vacuolar protein sorting-associated protein 13A/C